MPGIEEFQRLFAYDSWANHEALASVHTAPTPPARAQRIMAHIIAAERVWLGRLRQEPQWVAIWPELTPSECENHLAQLPQLWRDYLVDLSPEALSQTVSYANSQGQALTNRVEDILMHVIIHSGYHRGQIALEVRAAGGTPAMTDFIHATRQGLIESD